MPLSHQSPRVVQGLYRLGAALIEGNVATLFSAQDLSTGDSVAVLLARPPGRLDLARAQTLLQPLRALQTTLHPHLLHLRDTGLDGDEFFAVTDLRGRALRELLNTQALPLDRALEIARQLAHGVGALHAQQVYGIDLRPDLVRLETSGGYDTALLADIGLRRFLWSLGYEKKAISNDPLIRLDPQYAAPEQLQQRSSKPTTDIYSLGLLLFEMIAGRLPFTGNTSAETRSQQLAAPIPNLTPLRGTAQPELQTFIERALAKHPSLRFSEIEAFCDALARVQLIQQRGAPAAKSSRPIFPTAPMEALQGQSSSRPAPAPPPSSALASLPTDPEALEITLDRLDEEEEATLSVPGRARLLIGQSERKKVIPIKRLPAILGRGGAGQEVEPDIDLAPYDSKHSVSRRHARIIREGDLFYIEDLKSVNKTWLGELLLKPYERQMLRRHDRIQVGLVELIFEY
jgi:serine/threonine protein kinase